MHLSPDRAGKPFAATHHSLHLVEQIAIAIQHQEAILLVGETGTGKTSAVQHLAELVGRRLIVINLSQQSDATDLLGGLMLTIFSLVLKLYN
ncbi:unnamed protein product [Protopolystoma xenopodis]|nr:unnamed protein product [Protopolystoma xenopodis]